MDPSGSVQVRSDRPWGSQFFLSGDMEKKPSLQAMEGRARMTHAPHPVALLLDDALRAFFTKKQERLRPIVPPRPYNTLAFLRHRRPPPATRPDANVYSELPYDVQLLGRSFTLHPVSLLVKQAHALWSDLQEARKMWSGDEESRVKYAQRLRDKRVKSDHHCWLLERRVKDAWERSGTTLDDLMDSDDDDNGMDYSFYDPYRECDEW